jgi:hypothetical protein
MALDGYREISEGVYESDAFITSRPKIDSARIRQILSDRRPAARVPDSYTNVSRRNVIVKKSKKA